MSRLYRNILFNLLGQGLLLVLSLWAVRYIFVQLGEDVLGLIFFSMTLIVLVGTALEMGLSSTMVREVATRLQHDPPYIHAFIRTASLIYWSGYVLVAGLLYLAAPVLVKQWITLKTLDAESAIRVLRIMGISGLLVLPKNLYISLFRGLQRMEFNNLLEVFNSFLQQGGIVVILSLGGSLLQVVCWYAATYVFGVICFVAATARFFPAQALIPGFDRGVLERNLRYSLNMGAQSVLGMVHNQADKIFVSRMMSIGELGYYGLVSGVIARTMFITDAVAQAAFPRFSQQFQDRDVVNLQIQYQRLQDLICLFTAPVFALIIFAVMPFLSRLLNEAIAQMLLIPTAFLCLGYYMNVAVTMPYIFSVAAGKPEISTRSNFYALFFTLPLGAALVYFGGLAGAALSWVLFHVFVYSYLVPRICAQCLDITPRVWFRHFSKNLGLGLATYGPPAIILAGWTSQSITSWGLAFVLSTLAFLAGSYWLGGDNVKGFFTRVFSR